MSPFPQQLAHTIALAQLGCLSLSDDERQAVLAFAAGRQAETTALPGLLSWNLEENWLTAQIQTWATELKNQTGTAPDIALDQVLSSQWQTALDALRQTPTASPSLIRAAEKMAFCLLAALAELKLQISRLWEADCGFALRPLLDIAIADALAGGQTIAVLYLSLDGLHSTLLNEAQRLAACREVKTRLDACLRPDDFYARTSSSQFALLLNQLHTPVQAELAASKISKAFSTPIVVTGKSFYPAPSTGFVTAQQTGSADRLLHQAQLAQYGARKHKISHCAYSAELEQQIQSEATIEALVVTAFEQNQLELFLQPQVDLASGICTGAEALLRWDNPDHAIDPDSILRALHTAGYSASFTSWLVKTACRMLNTLEKQGIDCTISINLTADDFVDLELGELFAQELAFWRIGTNKLLLEVTETSPLSDEPQVDEMFSQLHELGLLLAVDDFGMGYSSLWHLQRLPLHEIKLDRAFVSKAMASAKEREIVLAMVNLAHALKLEVVAEGVEDKETLNMLFELGCQRGQGYYFSKPLDFEQFIAWCTQNRASPIITLTD